MQIKVLISQPFGDDEQSLEILEKLKIIGFKQHGWPEVVRNKFEVRTRVYPMLIELSTLDNLVQQASKPLEVIAPVDS